MNATYVKHKISIKLDYATTFEARNVRTICIFQVKI